MLMHRPLHAHNRILKPPIRRGGSTAAPFSQITSSQNLTPTDRDLPGLLLAVVKVVGSDVSWAIFSGN